MKKTKYIIFLHAIIFLYSLSALCSKFASGLPFFSLNWCLLYALMIFILGVYAILWQQLLKFLPLNFAFANKSLTIVWGMLFGILIFNDEITPFRIIGALIVLAGVIVMVTGGEGDRNKLTANAIATDGSCEPSCEASQDSSDALKTEGSL